MTQYLLAMYYPQDADAVVPEDLPAIMGRVATLNAQMVEAGVFVSTLGLEFAPAAKVVTAGEPPLVSDGPYLESKEHLGGFWVIEVPDADAAVAWAAKASEAVGLPIEVRASPAQG